MENGKLKIERWGFRQLLASQAEWCGKCSQKEQGFHPSRNAEFLEKGEIKCRDASHASVSIRVFFTHSGGEVGIFTVLTGFQ